MAVCTKCGKEMKDEAKFCKACGGAGQHDAKKARVLEDGKKSNKTAFMVAAVVVLLVAGWFGYSTVSRAKSMPGSMMMKGQANREGNKNIAYAALTAENGEVKVPLDSLKGNEAKYFVYRAKDGDVKFFVLKATDGTVRVALDACQACYHAKLGYRQNGETLVCNNCGMGFKSTDVGHVTGGCSPIPVKNSQDGKTLTVKASELESGVKYF